MDWMEKFEEKSSFLIFITPFVVSLFFLLSDYFLASIVILGGMVITGIRALRKNLKKVGLNWIIWPTLAIIAKIILRILI